MCAVNSASLKKLNNKEGKRDHTKHQILYLLPHPPYKHIPFRADVGSLLQVLHLTGVMISHTVGLRLPTIPPLNTIRRQVFVPKQMGLLAVT
jgi:hypothetical protein